MNQELQNIAYDLRIKVIEMLVEANSGHCAGPLGAAEIFTALYPGGIAKIDPKNPTASDRDRVVVSAGHYSPIVYAALATAGFFPESELKTFRQIDSRLQGHVHNNATPGIETSGGPLGQGISQAVGMSLAAKIDQADWHTYCFCSDGEHNEGQTWEAIMWAGNHKLNTLTVFLDVNNMQIDGTNSEVASIEPIVDKYKAFKWHVIEIDGNDVEAIIKAAADAKTVTDRPSVIICHTVPGKGVSFMENNYKWHGKPPKPEEAKQAIAELTERINRS